MCRWSGEREGKLAHPTAPMIKRDDIRKEGRENYLTQLRQWSKGMALGRREGKIGSPDCADDREGGKGKLVYPTASMIETEGREIWSTRLRQWSRGLTSGRREGKIGSPNCSDDWEEGKGKLVHPTASMIERKGGKIGLHGCTAFQWLGYFMIVGDLIC